MTLRHRVEYAAVIALSFVLRGLPRRVALEVGAAVGALGWWLRIRRGLVLANLGRALPDRPERERRRIAARAARNFGRTVAEFVRFSGGDRHRVGELVTIEGLDAMREAMRPGGGAVVVTGHLGAWALYVTALAASGIEGALLVGKQHNPKVDAFILGIPGDAVRFISKGPTSPRGVIASLRENRAVVLVADQHVPRGEVAPFFGLPAATLSLPGAMAARYGTPVFVLAGHRVERGRHIVVLSPLPPPAAGDQAAVRHEVTARCNEALEGIIRAHPDQYFWYHRRWRDGLVEPDDDAGE